MSDNAIPGDGSDFQSSPQRPEPDAHGQAAFLLAECILHALVETQALTLAQAIDVVRTALEVKVDVAAEIGETENRMNQSLGLLAGIDRSLRAGSVRAEND